MGIKEKLIQMIEDAISIKPIECENGGLIYTIVEFDGMWSYIVIPKEAEYVPTEYVPDVEKSAVKMKIDT